MKKSKEVKWAYNHYNFRVSTKEEKKVLAQRKKTKKICKVKVITVKENEHNFLKEKRVQVISRMTPRMTKQELNEARARYLEDRTLLWCCKVKRHFIEKFVTEYNELRRSPIENLKVIKEEELAPEPIK